MPKKSDKIGRTLSKLGLDTPEYKAEMRGYMSELESKAAERRTKEAVYVPPVWSRSPEKQLGAEAWSKMKLSERALAQRQYADQLAEKARTRTPHSILREQRQIRGAQAFDAMLKEHAGAFVEAPKREGWKVQVKCPDGLTRTAYAFDVLNRGDAEKRVLQTKGFQGCAILHSEQIKKD